MDDIFSDCKEKFNDLDKLFIETIETIETNKLCTPKSQQITVNNKIPISSSEKKTDHEQRSRSYDSNINGYIVSRVQNESVSNFRHENSNLNYDRKVEPNDTAVKINLPKTINNKDNENISTGLMMMNADSSNKSSSKLSLNNVQRPEKKQGSFKKVKIN